VNPDQMPLHVEGKQVGGGHFGDIEALEFGADAPSHFRYLYEFIIFKPWLDSVTLVSGLFGVTDQVRKAA
jgi:hypothetical protein